MPLPWVRLDSQFPHNHKILTLAQERRFQAIAVFVCGLAHSGAQGTNGFIPQSALPFIHGTKQVADQLVEVALWRPTVGGWDIPDWAEYQPSNEASAARTARAKAAAEARWGKKVVRIHDTR